MTDEPRHPEHKTSRLQPPEKPKPSHGPVLKGPSEAGIARSHANIAAVLGSANVAKLEAETFDDPPASADPSPPLVEHQKGEITTNQKNLMAAARKAFDGVDQGDVLTMQPEWQPMDTARQDGRPLTLTDGNGHEVEAVWRTSRRYVLTDPKGKLVGKWVVTSFWAVNNAGGQKIGFIPAGWRAA